MPPAQGDASVRLFNLAPSTKAAGLSSSATGATKISQVKYSLGSDWTSFPLGNQTWSFMDEDVSPARLLLQTTESPPGPPIGSTQFLLGIETIGVRALLLNDAPVCAPALFFSLLST